MRKLLGREGNELINKGAWSKEEDEKLIDYIRKHGKSCWGSIPQAGGLFRSGKSCRLRWINYLRPDVKRGKFGEDEEELIIKLHALLGNKWSLIAGRLPGRTDNEVKNFWNTHLKKKLIKVKNFWNTHLKKKLIKMGLDPNKHRIGQALVRKYCTEEVASVSNYKPPYDSNCSSSIVEELSDCRSKSDSIFSLPDLNLDLTLKPPE